MTAKQTYYYFTLWNRVMVEMGWYHDSAKEKDLRRRALHVQAGCTLADGTAKSSKSFSNADFDRFITAANALLAHKNTGGQTKVDDDGARRRLVWRIKDDAKKAGLAPDYIIECARDLHVLGTCWEDLDLDSLTNLRNTIHDRASKKIGHDTRSVPHVRHYVLDKVPKKFVPRAKPTAPHGPDIDENEPF